VALDPRLLEILACPDDKGPLYYFATEAFLYCPRCRRRYEIHDDIPVMLVDEAAVLSEEEGAALVSRAEAEGIRPTFEEQAKPQEHGT
jgi:uncharacterized protein YbaR (Trm112 family)